MTPAAFCVSLAGNPLLVTGRLSWRAPCCINPTKRLKSSSLARHINVRWINTWWSREIRTARASRDSRSWPLSRSTCFRNWSPLTTNSVQFSVTEREIDSNLNDEFGARSGQKADQRRVEMSSFQRKDCDAKKFRESRSGHSLSTAVAVKLSGTHGTCAPHRADGTALSWTRKTERCCCCVHSYSNS